MPSVSVIVPVSPHHVVAGSPDQAPTPCPCEIIIADRGLRQAVLQARGDLIGIVAADGKTPLEEIGRLLPAFDDGWDVVFGSRALVTSSVDVPRRWYRRLGWWGFKLAMHCVVGLWRVSDPLGGFLFCRAAVARDLVSRLRIDGPLAEVDLLYLAQRSGYEMREVGVHWRGDGDSRLASPGAVWRGIKDLFRVRFGAYEPPAVWPLRSQNKPLAA
jgi:hypothetical protein